jgi:hypothetical protein
MRLLIGIILCLTLGSACFAQTPVVYSVPADSKGNTITITVTNESKTLDASGVRVQVQKCPERLTFGSGSHLIKIVRAAKESDVTFSFDVGREVKLGTKDTIAFAISDLMGPLGYKSVIISYTGPTVYKLDQNFPNPFNPSTTIYYQVPVESKVKIMVFDILGREVKTLVDEPKEPGFFSAKFEAHQIASGAYIYRMTAEPISGGKGYVAVKKLMVLK